jgi:DNA modification methylase
MQLTTTKITELSLDPSNVRKHSRRNLDAIKASLRKFGQQKPIVVDAKGIVLAGNGTLTAAQELGWTEIQIVRTELAGVEATAFAIADNRTAELAEWEEDKLSQVLQSLKVEDADLLAATGYDAAEVDKMSKAEVTDDEVPEPPAEPITKAGDLWIMGDHRVLCGDSTKAQDVGRLMNGTKAQLIHADPPYGMGKEKDGVQNDNLYADKLDAFQMAWWRAFRPHAEDNASAYIWGNAEELWRLWYVGGLSKSERLTFRNEIVWDKKTAGAGGISHMGAEGFRQYPCSTERCLFFMLGEQGFNTNADNYWEGWEPIRKYLNDEMEKCGGTKNWKAALGNQMGGHYFTKSQWCFPTEEAYKKLQAFGKGDAFKREHDELKREHDELKREHDELKREFYGTRAYFDNTHDNMTDVWEFNRVTGEKRHGHATPKPIEMMARAIKSSTQDGGLLVEPFLGSGSTLIAAEQLGRKCYGMEISPAYCDVIVQRWENLTGKKAVLDKPTT